MSWQRPRRVPASGYSANSHGAANAGGRTRGYFSGIPTFRRPAPLLSAFLLPPPHPRPHAFICPARYVATPRPTSIGEARAPCPDPDPGAVVKHAKVHDCKTCENPPRRRSEPRPCQFLTAGFFLVRLAPSVSSRRNAGDIAEGPEAARESAVCLDRVDAPVLSKRLRIQERWQCSFAIRAPSPRAAVVTIRSSARTEEAMKGNGRLTLVTTALALGLVALLHSDATATIAFVKNIGTANSGTTTTTSVAVPAAGVAAGNSIILTFASADAGTTYSATDSAGNTYAVNIQGAKAGIVRTVILSAHNVQALVSGNTITVTHPSLPGTAKRGLSADEFSGLAKAGSFDQSQTGFNSRAATTAADSGATATTTQAAELLMGAIGDDGPLNDGFTAGDDGQGGTYTVNASSRAGAGGTGAFTINPEYEIVALVNAYHAKGTLGASRNWAANIATYKGDANCGNGMVDAGEDCDEGSSNGTASSCCSASCRFVKAATVCRAAVDVCDKAETCDGSSTTCPPDAKQPATTPCTADSNPCTLDQCDGT